MSRDEGFTLSEMLVITALTSILLGASFLLLNAVTTMADEVQARTIAEDESRHLMDGLTRELRQAYEIEAGAGAFVDAQPRRCAFYSDVDRDGVPELVEYRVTGTTLYRSERSADTSLPPYTWGTPAHESIVVTSLDGGWNGNVFTYWDNSDPPGEVPSGQEERVSAVELRLVNSATVNKRTALVDLSTWVKVRAVHNTID